MIVVKKHVMKSFLKHFCIWMHCCQQNKKQTKEALREDLRK